VANDETEMSQAPTAFREAISRARLETVDVVPPLGTVPEEAPPARFEYRVERTKGRRKRRAAVLDALGRQGWELVAVDDGYAYLRRPAAAGC
jgi:hypothetical protein